jgi:hypothetical protein
VKIETVGYITLGKNLYKITWLQSVSQEKAIQIMVGVGRNRNQVVNAWKRANNKSVRNYDKK